MKAVVAAFNQEKARVGAFSVITNLRMQFGCNFLKHYCPLTRPLQVYAQLFHSQQEAVLQFLSNVPGPTGNSALHFVMTEWVAKHPEFYGKYETKVWRILSIVIIPSISLDVCR